MTFTSLNLKRIVQIYIAKGYIHQQATSTMQTVLDEKILNVQDLQYKTVYWNKPYYYISSVIRRDFLFQINS